MVIMKNALWKDILRDINKSKGRFISIAAIITLGVMLFTGVKIAPIDMKATADKYYDDYREKAQIAVSGEIWLDITAKGINKGVAIEEVQELLNIKKEEKRAISSGY